LAFQTPNPSSVQFIWIARLDLAAAVIERAFKKNSSGGRAASKNRMLEC
jgi:hypothetical protein